MIQADTIIMCFDSLKQTLHNKNNVKLKFSFMQLSIVTHVSVSMLWVLDVHLADQISEHTKSLSVMTQMTKILLDSRQFFTKGVYIVN